MNDLVRQAELYIEEKQLLDIKAGFRVVTGVSGGADSVCLLLILSEIAKKSGSTVAAVHVNHNLRGEDADADCAFVKALCSRLQVRIFVYSEDVAGYAEKNGLTLEEAGRLVRYQKMAEAAAELDAKIAVAHHMDDNAETILFNLIRGADLNGFAGIKPETQINGVSVIRPLLFASREQIEDFLKDRGQDFCVDATNYGTDYSRNRIRHRILTEMKTINPEAVKHICGTAALAGRADEAIGKRADEVFKRAARIVADGREDSDGQAGLKCEAGAEGQTDPKVQDVLDDESDPECEAGLGDKAVLKGWAGSDGRMRPDFCRVELDIDTLSELDRLTLDRVLYKAIVSVTGAAKDISRVHVEDTAKLLKLKNGSRIILPYQTAAVRENSMLVLKKTAGCRDGHSNSVQPNEMVISFPADLNEPYRQETELPSGDKITFETGPVDKDTADELTRKKQYTKVFDYDKIKGSLFITTRQPGDMIMTGNCLRNVNRLMISEKIPRDERDSIYILRDEEKVIWVIGYRISDLCKVTDETETVLKVTFTGR